MEDESEFLSMADILRYARSLGYRHAVGVLLSVPTDGVEEGCDVLMPQRPMVRLAWEDGSVPGEGRWEYQQHIENKSFVDLWKQ